MDQCGEQRNTKQHKGDDHKEKSRISLDFPAFQGTFFKIQTGPNPYIGQKLVNRVFISEAMGIMNENFHRLLDVVCEGMGTPAHAAGGSPIQRILHIHYEGLAVPLVNRQIDMVCVKRQRQISAV